LAPFDVMILPAAFTATTGEAHWEVLMRARAIENQCLCDCLRPGVLTKTAAKPMANP
jgi:nitrilase